MKPIILSIIDKGYRLYVPSSPQRFALALAKYIKKVYDDLTICVNSPLVRITEQVLPSGDVRHCDKCSIESHYYVTLWCSKPCTNKLVLAAGTIIRSYRHCGLIKIDLRNVLPGVYLVDIAIDDNEHREYIMVNKEYEIITVKNPCLDDEVFRLLRKYFDKYTSFKEAVEVISVELGMSKTNARKRIIDLIEKGCISIDRNRKIISIY